MLDQVEGGLALPRGTVARLFFFRDVALVVATAADSGWHAHRALQLVQALAAPFRLETTQGASDLRFALIAPGERHRLCGAGAPLAHLFIDCGPRAYATWRARGGHPQPPGGDLAALLAALGARGENERERAHELARAWCQHSLPGLAPDALDPRIERALQQVDRDPTAAHGHRQLAAAVHLSASRFAALFRDQLGMPVRNYVLWRRLLHAVTLLERGVSVTEAAHASGFADAAHLSRSFRKVLGAAPSAVEYVGF